MNHPATKFKRYVSAAINRPGKSYRFKKSVPLPGNGTKKTKLFWFTVVAEQEEIMIVVPLTWKNRLEQKRSLAAIPCKKKDKSTYLETWWVQIIRTVKEELQSETV